MCNSCNPYNASARFRRGDENLLLMLLRWLLMNRDPSSEARDTRSTATVLDAAISRYDQPHMPGLAQDLVAQGIKCAAQLAQLSDGQWEQLLGTASFGMVTAIKAELTDPTALSDPVPAPPAGQPPQYNCQTSGAVSERLRQFLLLPGADGKEAKPLGEVHAIFLGILATPPKERQGLILALCELMALVSGLFVGVAFEFRRPASAVVPEDSRGWAVAPTQADGMDGISAFVFLMAGSVAVFSVCLALFIASGDLPDDDHLCEGAILLFSKLYLAFIIATMYPLMSVGVWQLFNDATSPYPLLGCLFLFLLCFQHLNASLLQWLCEHHALEIYHLPGWVRALIKQQVPGHGPLVADKVLKPKAERRAAQLRERVGL